MKRAVGAGVGNLGTTPFGPPKSPRNELHGELGVLGPSLADSTISLWLARLRRRAQGKGGSGDGGGGGGGGGDDDDDDDDERKSVFHTATGPVDFYIGILWVSLGPKLS